MATPSEGGFKAKIVLLGEGAVGKTSIVTRYVENRFNDKHVQTLQVSVVTQNSSSFTSTAKGLGLSLGVLCYVLDIPTRTITR